MKTLLEILFEETKTLKTQFLEKHAIYAEQQYNDAVSRYGWKEKDWCNFFGLELQVRNEGRVGEHYGMPDKYYRSRTMQLKRQKMENETYKFKKSITIEQHLENTEILATRHYESSIEKLAKRIEKKELDIQKLKTVTSHIGVNIETVLTDGNKTVRAWTILASGEIQQPHFRYLVK